MLGGLFEKIKDAFIDKESGSIKFGSVIATAAGALGGSMLLAGPLAAIAGPAAGILAPVLGGLAGLAIKEIVLPMITKGASGGSQEPNSGFRAASQPARGAGQVVEQEIETPNVPGRGGQIQR